MKSIIYKELGEIAVIRTGGTPSRSKKEYWTNGNIPWIKIGDINGKYVNNSSEKITEVGLNASSAKLFRKGTIIYTIFATLGEVAILEIDATTNQAIAGIEIIVSNVDTEYLYYYLASIKDKVINSGRGVAQNNINLSILKKFKIPMPPLKTQKKIVESLDKVQSLIDMRKKQIELLDELIQSVFVDMFGDPLTNLKNWPKMKLEQVGHLERGKSKHRPRNAPELLGGEYPLIQTGDISNSGLYVKEFVHTYSELGLKQSKLWPKGTLCITIAANIAKTAILTFDACFPDSVVAFIPNKLVKNIYVQLWFMFLQKSIEDYAPESAQKNINLKILNALDIPVPPIDEQKRFESIINEIENIKAGLEDSLNQLETNFNSIMQKAFRGELFT